MVNEEGIQNVLKKGWPGLRAIYLFGSVAKGEDGPDSDLDIAALGPRLMGSMLDLSTELSSVAARDVDLVDLRHAPTILQKEIVTGGRVLWAADPREVEEFEIYVWASYQKLNEERAGIIAEGIACGRFYNP